MDIEQDPLDKFEEIFEKCTTNILMQFFLSTNQIMNDENVIIVALGQGHKPLGFFQDLNGENCNYRTLFSGMLKKSPILAKFQY
jgi:hypothetical protein